MNTQKKNPVILMIDDDDEDIYLTKRAFCESREDLIFKSVQTGDDLFDYLYSRGEFVDAITPDVILLDINIPKENGFEILARLRQDETYGHLPVSILSTSSANHDIAKAYKLGANTFITKSVSMQEMQDVAKHFCEYWFDFARLPNVS